MLNGHDLVGVLRPLHPPPADISSGSDLLFAIALGFAAALLVAELRAVAKRRRHGIRRTALDALKSSRNESPEHRLICQAKLLRDIVRQLDGNVAARLSGDAWLQHLDATFRTDFFTAGEGRRFMESLYRPSSRPDPDAMDDRLKIFINGLRRTPLALALLPLPLLLAPLLLAPLLSALQSESGALRVPPTIAAKLKAGQKLPESKLLRSVLRWLVWIGIVFAIADPRIALTARALPASGRDIVLVLDFSGSMMDRDLMLDGKPARREDVMKHVAKEFIGRRAGDRVGLVVFSSDAYVAAPLTFDLAAVAHALDNVTVKMMGESKTAIGDGLGLALKRLLHSSAPDRLIILLSDGGNNAGSAETVFAATSDAGQPTVNHMEVSLSTGGRAPYAQEMVLLKVRTILFHGEATKQEFEQPPLENFSWVQLGPDRSYRTFLNGLPAVVFERSLAIYPIKSGRLAIASFIHHLTLVGSNNIRALPVTTGVVVIPWFDTKSRRMRDAVIPARTMAFATAARENSGEHAPRVNGAALAAASATAFVLALAILFIRPNVDSSLRSVVEQLRLWRDLRELRQAARSGDPRVFRAALYAFVKCDPQRWQTCLQTLSLKNELAALDEYLFGSHGDRAPNLRSLNRNIARVWKALATYRTRRLAPHRQTEGVSST